jgi:hypothetical protein
MEELASTSVLTSTRSLAPTDLRRRSRQMMVAALALHERS